MDEEQIALIREEMIKISHYVKRLEDHILRLEYLLDFSTEPFIIM